MPTSTILGHTAEKGVLVTNSRSWVAISMRQKASVLVVDDELIVGVRLKAMLEKSGYQVDTFVDSSKALEMLAKKSYSIIVTDLKMPNIDGMEIFRFVREHLPQAKTIIISGFATVENAKQALQAGAYDFITKPFRLSHLKEIIDKASAELDNQDQT